MSERCMQSMLGTSSDNTLFRFSVEFVERRGRKEITSKNYHKREEIFFILKCKKNLVLL